jgi:hypothetical protein
MRSWEDTAISYVLAGFLAWCSVESQVYRNGVLAFYLGRGVPAVVLMAFALYLAKNRAGFGRLGTNLRRISIFLVLSYVVTYFVNGGILGDKEITRLWIFRLALTLLTGVVSYRLARLAILTAQTLAFCCISILAILTASALLARGSGVEPVISYKDVQQATGFGGMIISGYHVAFCLPGLMALRRYSLRYVMIGICLAATALTYKKGALASVLFALGCAVLVSGRAYSRMGLLGARRCAMGAITVIAIMCIVVAAVGFDSLTKRWAELYEGNPRGLSMRDQLWPVLLNGILTDTDSLVFGHGIGSTVSATGQALGSGRYAHNDWLEIAYTSGMVGLTVFLLLNFLLIEAVWSLFQAESELLVVAVTAYALLFSASIVSGIMYMSQYSSLLFTSLGGVCAWADAMLDQHSDSCRGSGRFRRRIRPHSVDGVL